MFDEIGKPIEMHRENNKSGRKRLCVCVCVFSQREKTGAGLGAKKKEKYLWMRGCLRYEVSRRSAMMTLNLDKMRSYISLNKPL